MAKYVVDRVSADNGGSLKGKSIQVVGVAYKPNVADVRETPAELVIQELKKAGAKVTWTDDLVNSWMGEPSTPLGGSDIAVVVTLHSVTDPVAVLKSAPYVFDTTGKVKGANSL
jgi:UDP-N-acetyl-D-glucosamine dehydrogenase